MKLFFRMILVAVLVMMLCPPAAGADEKSYPVSPPEKIAKKWRIGYYEGGPYKNYPKTLNAIVDGLAELGWIEPVVIPPQEDKNDTSPIWAWLASNVKSKYIEFVPDAYYSYQWDRAQREKTAQLVIGRFNEKRDIDLMIAMGTWAGQDLANNNHSVPIIVCSVSDALASKIVKSVEDSGYDHVHAHLDPKRFENQITAFHDIIGFKKLGVVYIDSIPGRSYAGLDAIRKIAKERNFEVAEATIEEDISDEKQGERAIQLSRELAPKIDAFYVIMMSAFNSKTLPDILGSMNAYKVPTFSQLGSEDVRQGVLLSISDFANFKGVGKFHAETIVRIFNGAKPRELSQVYEFPLKIAFNKATAKAIDLNDDIYQLILSLAEEVYDMTE
jgi:ABC-type uncharacterized transport system substrate-binding protein